MRTLPEVLAEHDFPTDFIALDGKVHRKEEYWFTGRCHDILGREIIVANFGNWKTGESNHFRTDCVLSDSEARKVKSILKKQAEHEEEDRRKMHEETAKTTEEFFSSLTESSILHPYLQRKHLEVPTRIKSYGGNDVELIIPAYDINGKIWGIQRISDTGFKSFTIKHADGTLVSGMRIAGTSYTFQGSSEEKIFVAEGYATAASIWLAFDKKFTVFCAFNAHNLIPVTVELRKKYNKTKIVVCADNDLFTVVKEKPHNTGMIYGRKAVASINNSCLAWPEFKDLSSKPTDFNDLHVAEGLAEVKAQIERCLSRPRELLPVISHGANGKALKIPEEDQVVRALLEWYGENICRWELELFTYFDGYWHPVTDNEEDILYIQVQTLLGPGSKNKDIRSAMERFQKNVPHARFSPRRSNPASINFENGTLHILKGPNPESMLHAAVPMPAQRYHWKFTPHSHKDFLMSKLPVTWTGDLTKRNEKFELLVTNTFAGDSDQAEKLRAVKQMYGSALCPLFPRLFLLVGKPLAGKSALIKPLRRLVDERNICGVDPTKWRKSFGMETMLGKLVNIVSDINTRAPISDEDAKLIEDRVPVSVDRKYKSTVQGYIPAIHIFGANEVPPTLDGSTGAHRRRWTFITCNHTFPEGNRDMSLEIYDECPEGVLNFAVEGLFDLLASGGNFANPESGAEAILEWEKDNDPVAQFIDDLRSREWISAAKIDFGPQHKMAVESVYEAYLEWAATHQKTNNWVTKRKLIAKLLGFGFTRNRNNAARFLVGLGQVMEKETIC